MHYKKMSETERRGGMAALLLNLTQYAGDGIADYAIEETGDKEFHILDGPKSLSLLYTLHGAVYDAVRENPEKWLFLIEQDPINRSPEEVYGRALAVVFGIPAENPVVQTYSNKAVKKAVKEGMDLDETYLSLAVKTINMVHKDTEVNSFANETIARLANIWNVDYGYLRNIINSSADGSNKKRFKTVNNRIDKVYLHMANISHELSAKELAKIMKKYAGKRKILVNVGAEYLYLFDDYGLEADTLFGEGALFSF